MPKVDKKKPAECRTITSRIKISMNYWQSNSSLGRAIPGTLNLNLSHPQYKKIPQILGKNYSKILDSRHVFTIGTLLLKNLYDFLILEKSPETHKNHLCSINQGDVDFFRMLEKKPDPECLIELIVLL